MWASSSSPFPSPWITTASSSSANHPPELAKRLPPKNKEPIRPKTHWDFVLDEMAWLAKDFEKERKWKLSHAKKVAVKASKSKFDNAAKGQKRLKEEEQRIRRMASNVAKDVKKFWTKIEKLVVYKHQLELEEQKKKALDKHLDFLVGQTERYSTMLAEILTDVTVSRSETQLLLPPSSIQLSLSPSSFFASNNEADPSIKKESLPSEESPTVVTTRELPDTIFKGSQEIKDVAGTPLSNEREDDDADFYLENDEEMDDDEATLEADEALITEEERREELAALERESSLPLEELLKRYKAVEDTEDEEGSEKEGDKDAVLDSVDANEEAIDTELEKTNASENQIADAAAAAQSAQPTGFTFLTTKVRTKLPFLLKHSLREYQHIGLDWLVTMYEKRLNGILADEMGLGKTIMTIALLAHLACDKGIWGPHLIVVPTSVMLNWETEFMKWCPAFKILTYFGSAKERKIKRQGWSKPNSFHVCITTYRLVIQDAKAFKRKKWKYLILDEAHLIKNWKSQRWQTLLNFNSKRRILLTGTPLQNDLMELWSLMHFLMPHIFQSHQEFRDWFNNPITGMVEGQEQINKELVDRLHNVLRPFILRRLKQDVEKQLPKKYEHVIRCRLSKRQRNLYEDFMASSDTQATLTSGNFLGLINVLMQLRKVCNHPDLFEGRPIISSFDMLGIDSQLSTAVCSILGDGPFSAVNLNYLNFTFSQLEYEMSSWEGDELMRIGTPAALIQEIGSSGEDSWKNQLKTSPKGRLESIMEDIQEGLREQRVRQKIDRAAAFAWLNMLRCSKKPLYGIRFRDQLHVEHPVHDVHKIEADPSRFLEVSSIISDMVLLSSTRCERLKDLLQAFVFAIPAARAPSPVAWCSGPTSVNSLLNPRFGEESKHEIGAQLAFLRPVIVRRQLFFPDRRLLQFDCGKLQELAILLRRLKSDGHRALIFTQMTKMLDVLESFVNLHGYTYLRLDGSTKPEERQILMQRFNTNPKIFLFILSTRSGGVGVNLVGADTVIFYDSDWNPAMDQQAQDRCHRIGQTREVHIYRLISESTIEENILKKANQKRALDDLVIQGGSYNTDFFKKLDPMELLSGLKGVNVEPRDTHLTHLEATVGVPSAATSSGQAGMHEISSSEVEAALRSAEDEADYMALKKVEQEEAAERQEFTEEGFPGNMEDDECADDLEEGKIEKKLQNDVLAGLSKPEVEDPGAAECKEVVAVPTDLEEDMDMLADVKQMAAAAAAAGHGSASFDDQLRPIERYAMRFLEIWDPIIDKAAITNQVVYEEAEWELDQLEKLKEEQEAEIDEDNEPLFYESWDTSFADEAYRQQVEVLAQQQEYLRQLEIETMEEDLDDAERADGEAAGAKMKKLRKAKFKSLKKGSLTTRDDDYLWFEREEKEKDADWRGPDSLVFTIPFRGSSQRKRQVENDMLHESHKKMRNELTVKDWVNLEKGKRKLHSLECYKMSSGNVGDVDSSSVMLLLDPVHDNFRKSNLSGKFSLAGTPLKKGPLTIKLQIERKKDGARSREHIPPADPWVPGEDAVLCAVVHEYGGNWHLASETLAAVPDGGVYRGRYRHPIHCRERYRQLLSQHTSISATGDTNHEKGGSNVANAQLKVTEVHIKQLLQTVQELPDDELLLQHHFVAVLTAMDLVEENQAKCHKIQVLSKPGSSPHYLPFIPLPRVTGNMSCGITPNKNAVSDLVASALAQSESQVTEVTGDLIGSSMPNATKTKVRMNEGSHGKGYPQLELSVEFTDTGVDPSFPQSVTVSVYDLEFLKNSQRRSNPVPANSMRRFSRGLSEHRYRLASKMGFEGEASQWAASAGSGLGIIGTSTRKTQTSGKRRFTSDPGKSSEAKLSGLLKGRKKNKHMESTAEAHSGHTGGGEINQNDRVDVNTISPQVSSSRAVNTGVNLGSPVLADASIVVRPLIELNNPSDENLRKDSIFDSFEAIPDYSNTSLCQLHVPDLNVSCIPEQSSEVLERLTSVDGAENPLLVSPNVVPVGQGTVRDFDLNGVSSSDDVVVTGFSSSTIPNFSPTASAGVSFPAQLSCV